MRVVRHNAPPLLALTHPCLFIRVVAHEVVHFCYRVDFKGVLHKHCRQQSAWGIGLVVFVIGHFVNIGFSIRDNPNLRGDGLIFQPGDAQAQPPLRGTGAHQALNEIGIRLHVLPTGCVHLFVGLQGALDIGTVADDFQFPTVCQKLLVHAFDRASKGARSPHQISFPVALYGQIPIAEAKKLKRQETG